MFLLQIVSSSLIWCLKITHACGDISLYCSLHWDWSSQSSKRTQEVDIFDFPMRQLSPIHWRRSPRLLKCKIRRFRAGNNFHYVLSPMVLLYENCCLLRVCVRVSYKQLRPYKDWEQKEVSIPWQLENIFLHSRASFYILFSFLVFSHLPCTKPHNQANKKSQTLPLSLISICITGLQFRLHCSVYLPL